MGREEVSPSICPRCALNFSHPALQEIWWPELACVSTLPEISWLPYGLLDCRKAFSPAGGVSALGLFSHGTFSRGLAFQQMNWAQSENRTMLFIVETCHILVDLQAARWSAWLLCSFAFSPLFLPIGSWYISCRGCKRFFQGRDVGQSTEDRNQLLGSISSSGLKSSSRLHQPDWWLPYNGGLAVMPVSAG